MTASRLPDTAAAAREGEHALSILEEDTVSTATTFTDTTVTASILHVYRVKAINSAGVSQRYKNDKVTP